MGSKAVTPSKNSRNKILNPHKHLHIIGRKSTKFRMNLMKCVVGLCQKWSNKNSKTKCTFSYHRKKVYKVSNESDERCKMSCGEIRSRTDGRMDGRNNAHTVKGHFYIHPPSTPGDNKDLITASKNDAG